MNCLTVDKKLGITVGKKCYFYDERAEHCVCTAHVLHILPHPEREDDILIIYRWYGKYKKDGGMV